MDFSAALVVLKDGGLVQRAGWNGKGMFIFLVAGSNFNVNRAPLNRIFDEGTPIKYHAHIDMRTADAQIVPWLCSQTDMLADDWHMVKREDVDLEPRDSGKVLHGDEIHAVQVSDARRGKVALPGKD